MCKVYRGNILAVAVRYKIAVFSDSDFHIVIYIRETNGGGGIRILICYYVRKTKKKCFKKTLETAAAVTLS